MKQTADQTKPAIIAEIKKTSPSAGLIRENFDVAEIAHQYQLGGASCISVLTDTRFFSGHDSYIRLVKKTTSIPVLRKDFILDPYQVYESRFLGADCILLIMAALPDKILVKDMYQIADGLGMDVIFEIHHEAELDRASLCTPGLIGVNSRDLKRQKTCFQNFKKLAPYLPDKAFKIAESGINSPDDLHELRSIGYAAFLIGEHFMRQRNILQTLKQFMTCQPAGKELK